MGCSDILSYLTHTLLILYCQFINISFSLNYVSIGIGPLNFVMLADFSFPRLASTAGLVLGINSWVCAFFANLLFPMMAAAIGLSGVSWIYGTCAALGAVFVVVVLPETRGKSFHQIEALL